MMIDGLNPGFILVLGGLLVPLFRGRLRQIYMLALPVLAAIHLVGMPAGIHMTTPFMGYELILTRVDDLSFVFGLIFLIAALLGNIYAWHVKDLMQQVAALLYSGAAVTAVFAGDMITLFICWEGTAIASVFLIWARRTETAYQTGMRYLIVQVTSGVLLLAGVILKANETGSIAFDHLGVTEWVKLDLATGLILIAFGIKAAFPLLHNWLQDAYPQATVTGAVILSAFTTKLAIYALARGFAGLDILIPIGATMTAFPVFFAVIENDLRKVLSYSLNNQLGFMVVGIGIGTSLSLNGTAAHAFSHILYKALLFMSMGAVLYRTGTVKASELGGLYKSMPLTTIFCIIGAMSISAFPLMSGFISKSLILAAAAEEHMWITWTVLLFASAGVLEHSGIKIPYFSFFAHDSGRRVKEAPTNMLIAMGATALLCIGIGVFPHYLYAILPYPMDFEPYTLGHIVTQMQLLMFATLAFVVLVRVGLYPPEMPSVNLDTDWIYRRGLKRLASAFGDVMGEMKDGAVDNSKGEVGRLISQLYRHHGPQGILARSWQPGSVVLWVVSILLGVMLLLYYV